MKWTDTQDIAMALTDKHQDIDPQQVRFTDLHRWVTELEGFDDDPNRRTKRSSRRFRLHGLKTRITETRYPVFPLVR